MSESLVNDLLAQLQGGSTGAIAQQLGTDTGTAHSAIAAALPMLLGSLGRNARQEGGADALFGALQQDHSGAGARGLDQVLGQLSAASQSLGGADAEAGAGAAAAESAPSAPQLDAAGILGHIFGGNQAQAQAQAGLGQAAGLSGGQSGQLLAMLAPIVMSFLAQRVNAGNLGAGGLGQMLGQEQTRIRQQGGVGGDLLGSLLDQDGDGKFGLSDVMKLGSKLLGGR